MLSIELDTASSTSTGYDKKTDEDPTTDGELLIDSSHKLEIGLAKTNYSSTTVNNIGTKCSNNAKEVNKLN